MHPPVVLGQPTISRVLLVGQAPGPREGMLGRPFAWTAGKTLFRWMAQVGLGEGEFRGRVYMAAVCRCFPGKNPAGGDRVPSDLEIASCAPWLDAEIKILKPSLVLPVGRLAIAQFTDFENLTDVVGTIRRVTRAGVEFDLLALPHPSGASTWHRKEPGLTLLTRALELLDDHPEMQRLRNMPPHRL